MQQYLEEFNAYRNDFVSQNAEDESQMSILRGANKVLSFVSLATGFTASFLLGSFGALAFTTLATYCLTEDISLRGVFQKVFNPVKVVVSKIGNVKIGDVIQNTKEFIVKNLGIGVGMVTFGTMTAFLTLSLGPLGFLGGLGIGGLSLFGMVNQKGPQKKVDNFLESEVRELVKSLTDIEKSTLSITDKEALQKLYIDQTIDNINAFSSSSISKKDLKIKVEQILKKATSVDKMSYSEFFEFYKSYFNNKYSADFKTLDISNSVGVKNLDVANAKKFPDAQDRLLREFTELSMRATTEEDVPYITYAFVNKRRPQGGIRIGITKNSPKVRIDHYKTDSNTDRYRDHPLYADIKSQGIDDFDFIILDVQKGRENAIKSEEFFTIYFNRDAKTNYGYDLDINRGYNRHVADLSSLSGDEHPAYVKGIYFDDLNKKIEEGYELSDLTVIYGADRRTIDNRIKTWYSNQFGSDVGYNEISTYLRTKKLIEYYSQGLTVDEIALKFKKFDVNNKLTAFSDFKKARELYENGEIPKTTYSSKAIYQWTLDNLRMKPATAYEQFFVKPIIIALLQCGFERAQALEILEAMGVTNPNRKGKLYDRDSLSRLVADRLWGKGVGASWNAMRDIFLEPIIENLIRKQTPHTTIDKLIGRGKGWTSRYIKRRWGFDNYQDAKNFFLSHYLGLHGVNDYLD